MTRLTRLLGLCGAVAVMTLAALQAIGCGFDGVTPDCSDAAAGCGPTGLDQDASLGLGDAGGLDGEAGSSPPGDAGAADAPDGG